MRYPIKFVDRLALSAAFATVTIGVGGGLLFGAGVAGATPAIVPSQAAPFSTSPAAGDDEGAAGPGGGCTELFGGSGSPNTGTHSGGNGTGAEGSLGDAPGALPVPTGPGGSASAEVEGGSGCDTANPDAANPDADGPGATTP